MPDGRRNNGGHKTAGRKPKAQEQKLIEKLKPLEPLAYEALQANLEKGEGWAVKLFFEYMNGKPVQRTENENTNTHEVNIPILSWVDGAKDR